MAGAVLLALLLLGGLHLILSQRRQWLVASLLIALAYILFSAAPKAGLPPAWEPAVRWGLFLAAILGLVRFRFWARWPQEAAGSGEEDALPLAERDLPEGREGQEGKSG